MTIAENQDLRAGINYEDTPIVQEEIEGTDYRVDAGRESAVAISRRETGTWEWSPVTEGRWDGTRLKAKGLDHPVVSVLARSLAAAMGDRSAD